METADLKARDAHLTRLELGSKYGSKDRRLELRTIRAELFRRTPKKPLT